MGLKREIRSLEDVGEEVRGLYVKQDDGTFALDVEGGDDDGKLKEFRAKNKTLLDQVDGLRSELEKFKDVDPKKYRKALQALEKIEGDEERKLIEEGKLDEVLEKRTAAMRADFERKIEALTTARDEASKERDTFRGRLSEVTVDTELAKALNAAGKLRGGALEAALLIGRKTWAVDADGRMAPVASGAPAYGKKGDVLTAEEWAADLLEKHSYLFEGGGGSGANGSQLASGGRQVISAEAIADNLDDVIAGKKVVR